MVIGPIIGKFYLHQQTKKIRVHLAYTIIHSIVKGCPNFGSQKFDLVCIFILLYTIIYY